MEITKLQTINDYQLFLEQMYGNANESKDPDYIYSFLVRKVSFLSRAILRDGEFEKSFIQSLSWLFTLASKFDINLNEAFYKKFPDACPYCLKSTCECVQTHKQPAGNLAAYAARHELNEKFLSLQNTHTLNRRLIDKAVSNINDIYPSNGAVWKIFGSFYHFSRIFEELGETQEAYSAVIKNSGNISNLAEEIADVAAWIFSAWGIKCPKRSLGDAFKDYYLDGCPVCKKNICECESYSGRSESMATGKDLENIKSQLTELSTLLVDKSSEINELVKSIDDAMEANTTLDAKRAVTQADGFLKRTQSAIESGATTAENTAKIATALTTIIGFIDKIKDGWLN
ncbi:MULTISPECIES: hypothetical protein [Enterobacter]|uniref:hypothetical protein n=1 Tax=Enterobacter TaxID=547 RepID=UPI0010CA275D|nr:MULTISPECIES: hypothetical protein [Enterobacter]MDO2451124.1 hypothetical protein [Enterobacter vonholyi]MEB7625693.1 hypothetical protein [Enterobacter vonholyi]BBJ65513.1 hypothetical protein ECC18A13_000780 [Enterobacter sp. 18A13]